MRKFKLIQPRMCIKSHGEKRAMGRSIPNEAGVRGKEVGGAGASRGA